MIGNPLRIDEATTEVSRPSVARVCVEIDLTKPLDDEIAVGFDSTLWIQKLNYERIPKYCSSCKHVGHNSDECRGKNSATNTAGPSRNVTTVTGKVDGAKHHSAANGQKRDQDPHAHTSDNVSQENAQATSAAPRMEAPCPAAAAVHVANKDAAAAADVPHAAHASDNADVEDPDSCIAAVAHVANKDAAAAAATPHAAHASENVAHAPASPAVPYVPNKDAAAHAPASPAVPHVANKDAAAAAAIHAAVQALEADPHAAHAIQDGTAQAVPHVAEDASTSAVPHVANKVAAAFPYSSLQALFHAAEESTSATPRHPPAGDEEFDESYFFPRPYTAPSSLNVEYHDNKKKKHKNKESDESCQNKKKKEKKKKKKGKKPKDILILPALVPDENESDDVMR